MVRLAQWGGGFPLACFMSLEQNKEDKILIEKAQAHASAYQQLYEKYARYVFLYLWQRVGRKESAEDLMQETFLRAFSNLERYEDRGYSYSSYLMRIAHNLLVNHYRKAQTIAVPHPEWFPDAPQGGLREVEETCDSLLLWEAMKDLPIHEQNALILYYWDGFSVREAADKMQKSENAVKLLLSRGRKHLAKHELFEGFDEMQLPKRIRDIQE